VIIFDDHGFFISMQLQFQISCSRLLYTIHLNSRDIFHTICGWEFRNSYFFIKCQTL